MHFSHKLAHLHEMSVTSSPQNAAERQFNSSLFIHEFTSLFKFTVLGPDLALWRGTQ